MAVSVSATDGHPGQNQVRKQHSGQAPLIPFSISPLSMELVGVGRVVTKVFKRIEKERPKSTPLR